MTTPASLAPEVLERVEAQRETIITFMRDICRIPSMESQIGAVGERVAEEMRRLGFDEVRFDTMGNIMGRIGTGPTVVVYDSHIDTVGIGNASQWGWDPFEGKIEDGILYARGAGDEKQSTPGMVYGMAIARDLGLLEPFTLYYFGNMEEWCDGIAPHAFVEHEGIRPDFVVIGEPTKMGIYRGHKGRVELQVISTGKAAHAASNELGDNAVYKVLPIIAGIRDLNDQLPTDDFLGQGRITVTKVDVETPSINAVPDKCVVTIDRRVTWGEKKEDALAQVAALIPEGDRDQVHVEIMHYDDPSYTGFVFPVEKYFPAWQIPADHMLVEAGQQAYEALWGERTHVGKWGFSTNGIYWAGKAGIPSIGFAAGDEIHAHTVIDQVPLEDMVRATAWYALLPATLAATLQSGG